MFKNSTLHVARDPQVLLELEGDIAIFYDSILHDGIPGLLLSSLKNAEFCNNIIKTNDGRKLKFFDISSNGMKTFKLIDIEDYDKIFIANINSCNYWIYFELLMPVPKEMHANVIGPEDVKKIYKFFDNVIGY